MTLWLSYWWCDHCAAAVDNEHATIAATHALEGGGCGKRLTERFNSIEPPEDAELPRLTAERDALAAENARLREALTPSAETKAAYSGEFVFHTTHVDEDGDDVLTEHAVPWTTIKEIMAAIRARSLVEAPR